MTGVTRLTFGLLMALMLALKPAFAEEKVQTTTPAAADSQTVVVFAAASLKTALDKIVTDWQAKGGAKVAPSYAASSLLAKQIESGAPADIFISADLKWMDYAAGKNLIEPASRVDLLGNSLVLVAPKNSTSDLKIAKGFDLAKALGDGRLATGETSSVPAGIYAKAALTSLGVWAAVEPKIAAADNVRSALAFVARNEVPFGIVYKTDANSEPLVKIIDVFPAESHPPIVYPLALTAAAASKPAAKDFFAFLKSKAAAKLYEEQGFIVLAK